MKLNDLSAKELARIDAICLEFESEVRRGVSEPIDDIVRRLGGKHSDVLRAELEAVVHELSPNSTLDHRPGESREPVELPPLGDTVGPYQLVEVLGRGGMGIVYKAVDTRLERTVAIKMLNVRGTRKLELTERFQREAKSIAKLSHPNIVELFDIGVSSGVPYAVMEYLQGGTLMDRLQHGPLDPSEVRRLGAQIADALAVAHAQGVVHRDLKPQNIMLARRSEPSSLESKPSSHATPGHNSDKSVTPSHPPQHRSASMVSRGSTPDEPGTDSTPSSDATLVAKLVDFGLSRGPRLELHPATSGDENTSDAPSDSTRAGTILGTPGYMSPEQARGEPVTHAADIFALGCVLFECFYGKRAFDGASATARFASVLESTPLGDPVRKRQDPALAQLIDYCLEKSIDARPASASEVAQELRHGLDSATGPNTVSWKQVTSRRRFMESIAGAFIGALSGQILAPSHSAELHRIRRIGVVSLVGKSSLADSTQVQSDLKTPIGDRALLDGEHLASMLAQQLGRMPDLEVRPYRPILAKTPDEFRTLGRELDVDALVTGTSFIDVRGSKRFREITLQMVSANSGNQIWSETIVSEEASSLLEQSELVSKMASAIGRRLAPTSVNANAEASEAFRCLAKGHAYLDPDNSCKGIDMAVACFEHAISVDARYPDAHAGLALTLIASATRGDTKSVSEIAGRVSRARDSIQFALDIDPTSFDARLASSILAWQTLAQYDVARSELQSLASTKPNDWRVHHQLGMLAMTKGDLAAALQSLRLAARLNPQSLLIRSDLARLNWYSGDWSLAIDEAEQLEQAFPGQSLASGLVIDIYEQQQDYESAAQHDPAFPIPATDSRDAYFQARHARLSALPYGPFGSMINEAIWASRHAGASVDEPTLNQLADAQSPALPPVLALHPSFAQTRRLERALQVLAASS